MRKVNRRTGIGRGPEVGHCGRSDGVPFQSAMRRQSAFRRPITPSGCFLVGRTYTLDPLLLYSFSAVQRLASESAHMVRRIRDGIFVIVEEWGKFEIMDYAQ